MAKEARAAAATSNGRPKPKGWVDPVGLLSEFLQAFDLDRARTKLPKLPHLPDAKFEASQSRLKKLWLNGLPQDADSTARHSHEVEAVADVVAVLLENARTMLELPPGAKRNSLQRAIVTLWNTTLESREVVTLPTLCEMCGLPVLRRRTQKKDDTPIYPTVCDDTCQNARTKRRKRESAQKA